MSVPELLDDDGYPTEVALALISDWRTSTPVDFRPWFALIKSAWWNPEWGWSEEGGIADDALGSRGGTIRRYLISTGGWSGNESLIGAMQKNRFAWMFTWEQSRRGGHYIFDARES